jgi:hypothetical protein
VPAHAGASSTVVARPGEQAVAVPEQHGEEDQQENMPKPMKSAASTVSKRKLPARSFLP